MAIKTCHIAWVKREMGLTRGPAWNRLGQGPKVPPPPQHIRQAIRSFIEKVMRTEGRVPTYREIQQGVEKLFREKSPKQSDPFLSVEQWAVETGIRDLAEEPDAYAWEREKCVEMVDEDAGL